LCNRKKIVDGVGKSVRCCFDKLRNHPGALSRKEKS
jgi:hypothetical protein